MSGYALAAFIDQYHDWSANEAPSDEWRAAVLDWIVELDHYVFDTAVKDIWHGMNAWSARIVLDVDSDRVVKCIYDVHNAPKTALCRWLRFAPFYDSAPGSGAEG